MIARIAEDGRFASAAIIEMIMFDDWMHASKRVVLATNVFENILRPL